MIKEKLKKFIEKNTNGNNKKNIENLVVFLILLIITILAINSIWGKSNSNEKNNNFKILAEENNTPIESNISNINEYNLQDNIENILSKMEGVGKVQVLLTYSEGTSLEAMYNETQSINTTEEKDSTGGTRVTESADVKKEIITDSNSQPITQKIVMPKIEGAIVIAEGGANATIKTNIVQAVSAVTGLSTYKVQVFEMSNK